MADEVPSWSLAQVRAEVEPVRERARSTATLVLTFTTAVLGGLAVNARTGTLTGPASLFAVAGAGVLVVGVLGLLFAATTSIVGEEVDLDDPVEYIDTICGRISSRTRKSLWTFAAALALLVVATGWDQVRPQVEWVQVFLDESVAMSVAPCDGVAPVLVGTARTSDLDAPGEFLTIDNVTAPCGEWNEPSTSARIPAGSIVAVLPVPADPPN